MGDGPARPARFLRIHYLIAALIPALIIALGVTGFVWAQKGVTLVVDGDSRYIKTQATSVRDLLAEVDVAVGPADVVTPSLDAPVL
ncbi:MAG: ubiquitin-like domain-containing protein, partial [Coriobacteriia bacterium]|nr:ubiquitin-like domain-containing protein [Coriobacteriia bacterium]